MDRSDRLLSTTVSSNILDTTPNFSNAACSPLQKGPTINLEASLRSLLTLELDTNSSLKPSPERLMDKSTSSEKG